MYKNRKSLKCPHCGSGKVFPKYVEYKGEKQRMFEFYDSVATNTQRQVYYFCECNDCLNEFEYNLGKETSVTFDVPPIITQSEDVKLHIVYESEFCSNYKIISLLSKYEEVFIMQIEDEEYPVLLSKETALELLSDRDKSNAYVYDLKMNRNR